MRKIYLIILLSMTLLGGSVFASPTYTNVYENNVELYEILAPAPSSTRVTAETAWVLSGDDFPYPGGYSAYSDALAQGLITDVTLTIYTDDLDSTEYARIWLMNQNGDVFSNDLDNARMYLDKMDYFDENGMQPGPGNDDTTHLNATTFSLDPLWLTDDNYVLLRWMSMGGINKLEIESSTLAITAVTIPAPGAVLLGSIGIGLVGWLRRRRTL